VPAKRSRGRILEDTAQGCSHQGRQRHNPLAEDAETLRKSVVIVKALRQKLVPVTAPAPGTQPTNGGTATGWSLSGCRHPPQRQVPLLRRRQALPSRRRLAMQGLRRLGLRHHRSYLNTDSGLEAASCRSGAVAAMQPPAIKIALAGAGMFGGDVHARAYADLQRLRPSPDSSPVSGWTPMRAATWPR